MRDKKHKVKKVKCKRDESTAKQLIFKEFKGILQKKKHLSFAQNFAIIDQGKQDYKVNYVFALIYIISMAIFLSLRCRRVSHEMSQLVRSEKRWLYSQACQYIFISKLNNPLLLASSVHFGTVERWNHLHRHNIN